MTSKDIKEIQTKLENQAVRIRENQDYVDGRNPYILNQVKPKDKPDHRIPTPLAKMTVDDMAGYAGREGDRKTYIRRKDEKRDDPFLDYVKAMEEFNKERIETAELYDESLSQGVAYEIPWTSDAMNLPGGQLTLEYKIVPTESVWLIWSKDIKPKLEAFVYFSGDKKEMIASVYYPFYREDWISADGGEYSLSPDVVEYPFDEPSLCIYAINRKQYPIFEAGKSLINEYDLVVSRGLNEVERFNDAILITAEATSEEFREAIKDGEIGLIDNQAEARTAVGGGSTVNLSDLPKYLNKDYSGVAEMHRDIKKQANADYRKTVKIPDMADENFAGNQSGVAMAYKLLGLEFMAARIDTYFNQGLMKRFDFYVQAYNAGSKKVDPNDYTVVVEAKRNLPVDLGMWVKIARDIQGVISKERLLEIMPKEIVDDVEKELQRQEKEQPIDVLGLEGGVGADITDLEDSDIEAIALNGAQITAAANIAEKVAQGELPREAGVQLVMALGIPREQAEKIVPPQGKKIDTPRTPSSE